MKTVRRLSRWVAYFLIPIFLLTCATTHLPPFSANPRARLESDEKQIWERSSEEQRKLDQSRRVSPDPLLEEYLNDVGRRLTPKRLKDSELLTFQFKVIQDPALNAFAYPNGKIYVHSGLIARVDNEAQLATVMAHEMTHSVNRHAVRAVRDRENKKWWYIGGIIALSFVIAYLTGRQLEKGDIVGATLLNNTARLLVGLGLPLAIMASINGYSRELESEADDGGMGFLAQAGYDVNEAPRVFELFQKTYGDSTAAENFFFGSHPRNSARIENYRELLAGRYARVAQEQGRTRDTKEFQLRRRVIIRENALLDIRAGRFNVARAALDKVLAVTPNDARAHYYYGEIHRLSEKTPRGEEEALGRYRRAVDLDPELAEAYRSMGLLYYKRGDRENAKAALRRYLDLNPKAADRQQIKDYIVELGG
ncbi:MAG: M48 family metalloprotease [Candidatus Tectomicrobia bacterium]|nr:M48 family metalloprotease [Candidatus Tectomicrobia bacterium]